MGHSLEVESGTLLGMTSIATLSNDVGIILHPPIETKLEALMSDTTLTVAGAGYSSSLVQAQTHSWGTIYVYSSPIRLFLSYGPVTLLAISAVALGCFALIKNGVPGDLGFLQILMATRNPDLDALVGGQRWKGSGNVPSSLKQIKLRYKRGIGENDQEYFATEPLVPLQ